MIEVSVIISARNEVYLSRTIESVLSAARGEIEVIAICDGYKPDTPLKDDSRVKVIYNEKAIGQRPAVNQGAKEAIGKYIFKLDAHCAVDEGFDVKLTADCEYDWTVIPRMYQLDPDKWKPKLGKRTDFMFFRSPEAEQHPFRIDYYDARTARTFPDEYRAYKKAEWRQGEICDTMACIGAGWFMHKDRFFELGMLDESHGHWGQMGVEIACKSWLSGGRQVVNKKTWFAHLWRAHAPWNLTQKQVDRAREYSKDLWMNNKWSLQKRPLSWLIEKFAPVPTWNGEFRMITSDLTLLYYTANRISDHFQVKIIDQLKYACKSSIVSVSQKPMDLGTNICVGETGASLQNIYKQVLIGLRKVKTEYVALVEDDCLYVPEHFNYRPKTIAYNLNRWLIHADRDKVYSYRRRPILSQCIAPTKMLLDCLSQREGRDIPKKYSGEPGLFEKKLGLKEYPYETFETKEPNLVVCHNKNTSGRKTCGKDAKPRTELVPWGDSKQLLNILGFNMGETKMAKFGRGSKNRSQHSYIGSIIFGMDEIMSELNRYEDPRHPGRGAKRTAAFLGIINRIADGEELDDDAFQADPCYEYFAMLHRHPKRSETYVHRRSMQLMREWKKLFNDIKDNGLKSPLDMWRRGRDKFLLCRGWRRLIIMYVLHQRRLRDFSRVPVRVFKSKRIFQIYAPSPKWAEGQVADNSIHGIGMKQFAQLGVYATDKYWIHNYTRQYDRHFAHLRDKPIKLLEIGVLRGASLLMWKQAFPRGRIYGLDKNTAMWKKFLQGQKRVKVFVGRQEDEKFLQSQVVPAGPYDVIIDDGGHTPEEQLASFNQLWPHVAPGGQYVIEDLHGNYWARRAKSGPKMMEKIKSMIDDTVGTNDCLEVQSLSAYYNIVFVEKN